MRPLPSKTLQQSHRAIRQRLDRREEQSCQRIRNGQACFMIYDAIDDMLRIAFAAECSDKQLGFGMSWIDFAYFCFYLAPRTEKKHNEPTLGMSGDIMSHNP